MTSSDLLLESRADSLLGAAQRNSSRILMAAVAVAAIAVGTYFYRDSQATKNAAGERAYFQAQQSVSSGNIPLATTDLRKAADRYRGTSAGNQSAFSLAQLLYDQGKYTEGVAAVERVEPKTDAERASRESLIAAGLEGQGKFADAAGRDAAAAAASKFPNERSILRASQARALMAAGKKADARAIWLELSKDPDSPLADEAKIRIGELSAVPAT
jgi:predicted negative regulator of RcsB-dependent stress response